MSPRRIAVAALLALALSGCAATARWKCESIYCAGYEPVAACPHYEDLVIICIEDELERKTAVVSYFGNLLLGLVQLAASII